eukprot:TRINITY_DN23875_c0_g1_i1.p3 TRINITY_DN23875_c0_g1~~TRINITY_DN23875_c0_g1_i1.p3  ORF type:complete len:176 (+),score=47.54 TRINITY_DN23875_c0_g1_i1:177-704(+)
MSDGAPPWPTWANLVERHVATAAAHPNVTGCDRTEVEAMCSSHEAGAPLPASVRVLFWVEVERGHWAHATFPLEVRLTGAYPLTRPRFRLRTPIFHPNFTLDGRFSVRGWAVTSTLSTIINALASYLSEPSFEDPLNPGFLAIAEQEREALVAETLLGGAHFGLNFECVMTEGTK